MRILASVLAVITLALSLTVTAGPAHAAACVTSAPGGSCSFSAGATNSNGFNTYVENNCWADPHCKQVLTAYSFGNWHVVSSECCNGSVRTAPQAQQVLTNWCAAAGTWQNTAHCSVTGMAPVSRLSRLAATYTEVFPHNSRTISQFAWDMWIYNNAGHPSEIMVWVDVNNRCNSGSFGRVMGPPYLIAGQKWFPRQYGTDEWIWVLDANGTCARQWHGTVNLLALLKFLIKNHHMAPGALIGEADATWEISSTGGVAETFTVSRYALAD